MAGNIQAIKGTKDTLPSESYKSQYIEQAALDTAKTYGFHEMRTPVFEYTELFDRSVGETTDVVQKEMYTFNDKGDRSITLRPEGTAGAVRAFLEHGLFNEPLPQKVCYLTSCYRYEKPQAGRLREFHQFGIECFGAASPLADAEVIALANSYFTYLGLEEYTLEINSIGCPECRKKYQEALKAYFEEKKGDLCETCLSRLERNPMRILDCKSPVCSKIAENAPVVLDYICDDCKNHFEMLKSILTSLEIPFKVNPRIVRGLDYYTKTVFEIIAKVDGNDLTVCGGGRYDGLVGQLGDKEVAGIGFGMGIERLLILLEEQNLLPSAPELFKVYVVSGASTEEKIAAFKLVQEFRNNGISAEGDHNGRSFKAQFKYANKLNVKYTVVVGTNELETGLYALKDMATGQQKQLTPNEIIDEVIKNG